MEEMVQRMLTLATVEEGDSNKEIAESTEVMQTVKDVFADLTTIAQLHRVHLMSKGAKNIAAISPDRWKTVCIELVQNAIRHSPEEGVVEVEVVRDHADVQVVVRNAGDGIRDELLPHLFERFYRGDPSRARSTGGTGLGLAICKAIVEQAGGRITVRNGNGVEVRVELKAG